VLHVLNKARLVFSRRLSMANFMDLSAAIYGERLAITLDSPLQYRVHMGDTMTYRQTSTLASHMAHAMVRLGVKRGDRVVVVTSNRVDLPILVGAIIKMGGVAVPLNFMLRGKEIAYVVKNCGARVLVTDAEVFKRNIRVKEAIPGIETWVMAGPGDEVEEGFESLDELMEGTPGEFEPLCVRGDDLVGIFYTSGTTGFPKGAMMTSRGMITGQKLAAMAMPLGPGDLGIHCLPLAHLFGYGICIMGQITGMSAYFMRYFNPVKVLQAIEEHRATVFVGVPVMYKSLFDVGFEDYDLSSMRFWASSADAMPQEYIDRVRRQGAAWHLGPLKTGPIFAEAYGMVELSAIATLKLYFPGLHWPPGCVGFPIYPVRAKVVESCRRVRPVSCW
jgi:long-chain acyl-CoA synthetase